MKSKISFICCYNNQEELNSLLLDSYDRFCSGLDCNIFLIDSKAKGYKSAAEAYNKEIESNYDQMGDILIFLHQDIAFDNINFVNSIIRELEKEDAVVGFCGMGEDRKVYSNLKYRVTNQFIVGKQINVAREVESLDECCFATTKSLWNRVRFDENVCFHWHLYATDFCYTAKDSQKARIVLLSDVIYHKEDAGGGLMTDSFYLRTMWRLMRKNRTRRDMILTPCYIVSTDVVKGGLKLLRTFVKNLIK